jgi:hypothetical protein
LSRSLSYFLRISGKHEEGMPEEVFFLIVENDVANRDILDFALISGSG